MQGKILQFRLNAGVLPIFGKTHFHHKHCEGWTYTAEDKGLWVEHPTGRVFFAPWHAVSWVEYFERPKKAVRGPKKKALKVAS